MQTRRGGRVEVGNDVTRGMCDAYRANWSGIAFLSHIPHQEIQFVSCSPFGIPLFERAEGEMPQGKDLEFQI